MFSFKADNVYDVAEPLHICSQLIGLTSFSIQIQNQNFVARVKCLNLLSILLTTVWVSIFTTWLINNLQNMWDSNFVSLSEVYENSMTCVTLGFLCALTISNWWLFFARHHFSRTLNLVQEVDNELKEMKVSVNFKSHKKVVLFFILVTKVTALCEFVIINSHLTDDTRNRTNWFITIFLFVSTEINVFTLTHFTFWMCVVHSRFKKINLFVEEKFLKSVIESTEDGNEKLRKVAYLHDKLVDATESINRCYGVPVSDFHCY